MANGKTQASGAKTSAVRVEKAVPTGAAASAVAAATTAPDKVADSGAAKTMPSISSGVKPTEPVRPAVLSREGEKKDPPKPAHKAQSKPAAPVMTHAGQAAARRAPAETVVAPGSAQSAERAVRSKKNEAHARKKTLEAEAGAKTMNDAINKTQEATKQAAEKASEQFRGAVSDANQRGRVAIERGARFAEEVADLSRGNMEAFVASSKTAAKYFETLAQGAADYSRRSFEEASATLRSFAEVKSPTDFFRLQSEYARSAFDSMVAESARVSETMVKMSGEVAEPITNRYSDAAERLKAVAA